MTHDPMNPPDDNRAAIRVLLETLHRQQGGAADPALDDLVRWVEGTLPPTRAASVELALVRNPALRHALTALRLGHGEAVPPEELARLESLVAAPVADVVPFPASDARVSRREWWVAAAAVALLLAPAWAIGTNVAKQRTAIETREIRQTLRPDFYKGGL